MPKKLSREERRVRLAELEHVIQRTLPGIQADDTEWLIAQVCQQKRDKPQFRPETLKQLWSSRYLRVPVGIHEFIHGERYLGPILASGIYPKIEEGLELLFKAEYTEVILGGAIGWGKTTFGTVAVSYDLYRLSCLRDPAVTYGMKSGSNMTFVNISVNKTQATQVFFQDLYTLIKSSWYFNRIFPYDRTLKNEIRFPRNVHCYPVAASEQAALGMGVFCAFIDEANFMDVVARSKRSTPGAANIYDQAEAVFNKLQGRMRSRMNLQGKLPGRIYVASSCRYPTDFTERKTKRAQKEAEEGKHFTLVLSYPLWETLPEGKLCKETFRVEVGDEGRSTRVLTGEEDDVVEANVIHVPVDFRLPFDRDPELAVRDLAGKSVLSLRPFISRRELIKKMFELGAQAGLKHPFTRFDVTLQQKDPAVERLLPENLHWVPRARVNELGRPLIGKDGKQVMEQVLFPALYHVHIDLSKSGDATGLCIAHNVSARKIQRFDPQSMRDVEELKPVIRVDLVLRIVAPPHGEIDIPRIRAILYELQRHYNMQFGMVTFDTWGSQEAIKTLKDEGFNSDTFSLDRDTTGYETLRSAIYDQRILAYHVPMLERELVQLERGPKKIDHPPSGSKDLADALAGALLHCEDGWRAGESSRGLFQLGSVERPGESGPDLEARLAAINAKVVDGHALTPDEENTLLFGDLELL